MLIPGLTYCLLIIVEILILYWILRPKTYNLSWLRSLSGSLFFFILGGAHLFTLMHAAPYMLSHCMFLFCIGIIMFILSIWSLVNKIDLEVIQKKYKLLKRSD